MSTKPPTPTLLMLSLLLASVAAASHHETPHDRVYAVPGALDFNMQTLEGKDVHLSDYFGKVMLAVNVASKCGYTPQYKDLQALHEKYQAQGLAIVGFPANDFGRQEPGTHAEIRQFCTANYGISFDMMSKIQVKGSGKHPFYDFLTSQESNPAHGGPVKWNFEKFLIGRDGQVVGHYRSRVKPLADELVSAIESELGKPALPLGLKSYLGRTIADTMHYAGAPWLLRGEREQEESTAKMIRALGLKPGQSVCDVGAGNGYHSLMMATEVASNGRVLAVDVQPEMLDMLKERAAEAGIDNVTTQLGKLHDPMLPIGTLDLVLLADVYHEFSHPVHMLGAIRKSLKPGGQVVLLEFRAEDDTVPIKKLHKMSRKQIQAELSANGFKLAKSYDELPWQHMMFYGVESE